MKFDLSKFLLIASAWTFSMAQASFTTRSHLRSSRQLQPPRGSYVFVMSNRVTGNGNSVLAYSRDSSTGMLSFVGEFPTGGSGGIAGPVPPSITEGFGSPNDALGSQDSLIVTENGNCLMACNAGSDTFTTFRIRNNGSGLDLVETYSSGGSFPVSLAHQDGQGGGLLYVLNAGGAGSVNGYRTLGNSCRVEPIAGSFNSLDAGLDNLVEAPFFVTSPAQVGFSPDGSRLVVTVKGGPGAPNQFILVWNVNRDGTIANRGQTQSAGNLPFSFAFVNNANLLVADAISGSVSSYQLNSDNTLSTLSSNVATGQEATCWLRTQATGSFVYASNNGLVDPFPSSISIFSVNGSGELTLVNGNGASGDRAVDISLSPDDNFLYVLNTGLLVDGGSPSITVFEIQGDGSLNLEQTVFEGLPGTVSTGSSLTTEGVFGMAVV